ncbi:D-amino acid dehydrogenase [Pseudoduganella violaceinigra]|uniref:D-amino acid dehydrogenase n=1 Tax=Pseudoduganella violaceinigra TaxID=246602 RepID=UPI00040425CE|nr:D-amino acid dehydrogenase [Pseudoduganella violaceinigra]
MSNRRQVVVIGGGVVGLASAWWLLEAGFRVTLLERAPTVASAASYRNGGQLSYRYVSPLADVGVPKKALEWLFEKDGPLRFRPEADYRQWRWMAQFLRNCNAEANARTTAKLLELGELSRQSLAQLEINLPLSEFGWRNAGKLVVYRSEEAFKAVLDKHDTDRNRAVLWGRDAARIEPALIDLAPKLAGGIFNPGEAVADCYAFCLALEKRIYAHPRFERCMHTAARTIFVEKGKVTAIETDAGWVSADHYVLAAGIKSRDLAATANLDLPIYPLKGYSLTAPIRSEHVAPNISVTDFERKTLFARIGNDLRVSAMVDLVGENNSIDRRRVASLKRLARESMPNAADYEEAEAWAGLRPATPNSAPIIGPTPYRNLWLNVGHGPLGFTFACGSASLLATMMRGNEPPFALDCLAYRK